MVPLLRKINTDTHSEMQRNENMDIPSETEESVILSPSTSQEECDCAANDGDHPQQKTRKRNGYSLFYQNISASILEEAKEAKLAHPTITEMSKISARRWKSLNSEARKDWNKKAQLQREDEDCEIDIENKCTKCTKTFKRMKDLRYHERNCGTLPCSYPGCSKSFGDKSLLKRHIQTHEKLFECKTCKKTFGSKQSYKRHVEGHEKRYNCGICGKRFTSSFNLKRHERNVHDKS